MTNIVEDGVFGVNTAEFCKFVFKSTTVTESQYNSMTSTGWGGGTSNGNGTSSSWTDATGFEKFGAWLESLFN